MQLKSCVSYAIKGRESKEWQENLKERAGDERTLPHMALIKEATEPVQALIDCSHTNTH